MYVSTVAHVGLLLWSRGEGSDVAGGKRGGDWIVFVVVVSSSFSRAETGRRGGGKLNLPWACKIHSPLRS